MPRAVSVVAVLAAACLAVGAGDAANPRTFSVLRIVQPASAFTSLDPALGYANGSWQLEWRVYVGLLTYRDVPGLHGTVIAPGLASALPSIGERGRTYTFTLRPGLVYSDGRPVLASDVKNGIQRLFLIDSPAVGFFGGIVGADSFAKTRRGGISGIVADDAARTITFRLVRSRNDFANVLAMPFAAAVPAGTPAKDVSATSPVPGTGPYAIASYAPNRSVVLVRNANFVPTASVGRGNPDRVEVRIGGDARHNLTAVRKGTADYDGDLLPPDQLALAQKELGDRVRVSLEPNTIYVWMNTRVAPFTDIRVRRAVEYAVDRAAIARLFGGLARPTENLLPPSYPAYRKLTLYPHDLARARALVRSAGATGAHVKVWGIAQQPWASLAVYLSSVLDAIGLKTSIAPVPAATFQNVVGNRGTHAQIGWNAWVADYPNPVDWFDTLLNGEHITATHNNNLANANDPEINALIDRLREAPRATAAVDAGWAKVDRLVVSKAFIAPAVNVLTTNAFSSRVDMSCYVDHPIYGFDWTRACVR